MKSMQARAEYELQRKVYIADESKKRNKKDRQKLKLIKKSYNITKEQSLDVSEANIDNKDEKANDPQKEELTDVDILFTESSVLSKGR